MSEPVRLVIWDLDETYWQGVLTEGGIVYSQTSHDIVIALARRGIMSSICSKNDLESAQRVLEEHGIWKFFIFPSINWEPKGTRVKQIVAAAQLRPATVMFIDDNPQNLSETRFFLPEIQLGDKRLLSNILSDHRFSGSNDAELTRLGNYKLLERRKQSETCNGSNNQEFLKSCNIRIAIENDVEAHLDRALELINRTNQLNFTKSRLPEDMASAGASLRTMLATFNLQAGLIRVVDDYGDYGYCGFFAILRTGDGAELLHYCFSCRILGMGVETFVYRCLNRPTLQIRGAVLSDPKSDVQIDWIGIVDEAAEHVESRTRAGARQRVFLRGGCDSMILEHYFRMAADEVQAECSFNRNGIEIRIDHSLFTRFALRGIDPQLARDLRVLGYEPEDFQSAVLQAGRAGRDGCRIFSFAPDAWVAVYRCNRTGTLVPFVLNSDAAHRDATALGPDEVQRENNAAQAVEAAAFLRQRFTYVGLIGERDFKHNLEELLQSVPVTSPIFVILANEFGSINSPATGSPAAVELNRWTTEVAAGHHNVRLLKLESYVEDSTEIQGSHFHRAIYFRAFSYIRGVCGR